MNKFLIFITSLLISQLILPSSSFSKNYVGTFQVQQSTALPNSSLPANSQLDTIIPRLDQAAAQPLQLSAATPATALLQISTNRPFSANNAGKTSGFANDLVNTFVASTINYQTAATTGGTIQVNGSTFALPSCTIGQFKRHVLVYNSTANKVDSNFSSGAVSVAALTNAGALFSTLDGLALGFVDLECTASGAYKTAGSATAIVENSVSSVARVYNFDTRSGSLAYQNKQAASITGGTISGTAITATNASLTTPSLPAEATFSNISTPSTPSAGTGKIYFKSNVPTYLNSSGTERVIANTFDSLTNPMTTSGDVIYGGASGTPTRLAGAAGVLHGAVGGAPSFSTIVNADVNASAAIAYSKLSLTGAILNADLAGSIAYSKLNLALGIVNADISTSAAIAYSKLNLGTSIVNADVNGSAAIAYSKLNLATSIVNADVNASAAIDGTKIVSASGSVAGVVTTGSQTIAGEKDLTSQVKISNGSVTEPSVVFSSDDDTTGAGLYRVGANSLGFAANGVNVGQYASTGDWTLGASGANVLHTINGTFTSTRQQQGSTSVWTFENTGSTPSSARIVVQGNRTSSGDSASLRLNNVTSGMACDISNNWENSTNMGLVFATYSTGAVTSGSVTGSGSWTLGPAVPATSFVGNKIVGKTDGVAVAAGYVGQVLEVTQTSSTNFPTSGQYGDLGSIALTPGIWVLNYLIDASANGATSTGVVAAISVNSGNTTAGTVGGINLAAQVPPTASIDTSISIPGYIVNISANTTYYAKVSATYTVGTPQYRGRLTAIRIN